MILFNDFKSEPQPLKDKTLEAVTRVADSGWYVLGPEVEHFESRWAQVCGVDHAVGVANGLDAIEIALRSLGIGPGDEVITTPMTAFATVLAIYRAGATPVLADIDPTTALLDINSVERCLSNKVKAVVLVHLYGQLKGMSRWLEFCRSHGLLLIEDCAQAHLARWDGQVAGSFGEAGAYSFYPTKNLGAPGDAGMLVTRNASLASRAKQLRNYGQSDRYHHPVLGLNSRLDEIHAAILTERMAWLEGFSARRRQIARAYSKGISNSKIELLAAPEQEDSHVYHLFVITCKEREALMQHLTDSGIQSLIHYPVAAHQQPPCSGVRHDPAGLDHALTHADTCLSLPCHPQLTEGAVAQVIQAVNSF